MASKKKEYLTLLTIINCIAVVFLHMNGVFWNFSYSFTWISANVIECLFYFAVSIFFMISGATLISYRDRYDTKTYFKKRVIKVFIPYLIWSILYICINFIKTNGRFSLRLIINNILNGSGGSYFWFFIPLFAVYLIIPIISLIPTEKRKSIFKYIIIIGFITISIIPFLFQFLKLNISSDFRLFSCSYILFSIIGYYIDNYEIKERTRGIIYLLGFIGLFIHIFGTFLLSYRCGYINNLFKGYLNFPSIFYSVAIFVFFKYFMAKHTLNKTISKITNFIAPATFGVYLIQQVVIDSFSLLVNVQSIFYRTFGACLVFIICLLLVKIIQKIPILKYITP